MSIQAMQDVPGCPVQQHNKYEAQRTTTAVPWPAEIEARSLNLGAKSPCGIVDQPQGTERDVALTLAF